MLKFLPRIKKAPDPNGAIAWYTGGPISLLAKIENCPVEDGGRATVYISGQPDSYFSIPATAWVKRNYHPGFLTTIDSCWVFCPYQKCDLFALDPQGNTIAAIAENGHWAKDSKSGQLYQKIARLLKEGKSPDDPQVQYLYQKLPAWSKW